MNDIREWILAGRPLDQPLLRTRKRRSSGPPSRAAEEESFAEVSIRREAIRQANHRGSARHRLDNEVADVTHDGRTQTVLLVNLSGGGAMIEGAADLKLWDVVSIRFGDCDAVEAAVRWIRGSRIGLEFAQETRIGGAGGETVQMLQAIIRRSYPDIAPALDPCEEVETGSACPEDRQQRDEEVERDIRHPLVWSGRIHFDHSTIDVRLRNISEGGALIECGRTLPLDAELLLDLDKAGSFFATVNWAHGDAAGLRFHERFDLQQLAAARHALAPARWTAPDHLRDSGGSASPWSRQRADGEPASNPFRRSIRR